MDNTNFAAELAAPGTSAPALETPAETLADVIADPTNTPEPQQQPAPQKEPRYLADKRAKWEAEHRAEMDELRGQLGTLREYFINQEADKLVADGKISDREMALNYLRMQQGLPVTQTIPNQTPAQPRDSSGRFVAAQPQMDDAQQRAQVLVDQATMLKRATGVDVMAIYNTNPQARQMIISGAGDFADVLAAYGQEPAAQAPAPIRSSNGMGLGNVDFSKMSSSQLQKVNELIQSGVKIDVRV